MKKLYLIGSLRNPEVPKVGSWIRALGIDVFDDWYAAGPEADDKWKEYEQSRGRDYVDALHGLAAEHVHEYDKYHLDNSDGALLLLPAGRSGHLELGYIIGQGKPAWILLPDDHDRWDVMFRFASVHSDPDSLRVCLHAWARQ